MLASSGYPKRYGTIQALEGEELVVRMDTGTVVRLRCTKNCANRTPQILPGVRVKVYKRPQDREMKFRRTGR